MELRDKIRNWIPQIPMDSYLQQKSVNKMVTNGVTATASTLLTLPFEYAHVRLAGSFIPFANTRSSGIIDSWMKTTTPGLGIFRGALPTVAHSILHRSAHLTYFDALTKLNPYRSRKDSIGLASKYITSQTSALLALFLAYPLDTVRVRMQMEANLAPADRLYNSSFDCMKKTFTQGGYSMFFKGFSAAAVKSVGGAIAVVWYNELRQFYDQKN